MAKRVTTASRAVAAYQEQWRVLEQWWQHLPDSDWERPSIVSGWRVMDLVAHFGLVADSIVSASGATAARPELSISQYLSQYAEAAGSINTRTRALGGDPAAVLTAVSTFSAQADACLRSEKQNDPIVAARRGPIRWSDFLATRCIELAVHSDDIRQSLATTQPETARACDQIAVRALAAVLSQRAPGRSVEVRVPPFAAIQCLAGPRHTRGTPAAVVEMTPTIFLRLAAGRLTWNSAVRDGQVLASGERGDLEDLLPLLV